jgi:hypothetical protein
MSGAKCFAENGRGGDLDGPHYPPHAPPHRGNAVVGLEGLGENSAMAGLSFRQWF